uniref:Cep57 centrosome microtubule-binding domain-containing protein n=1 Tax=Kwoniella bestiolae CBS 10118 TaxID=1296100 RepID=A0A1B9GAV9_9TREE|nr:hypothetical protein I302_03006 [Kwoniella bestiolae CBS 10118]OCF28155.1 hypothetical protein I302_03006 [Kwoniella bestiolae CBS 10118]
MDPSPILPSNSDLERRRLESTIDNDLHSLSLSSLPTSTTSHSSNSFISTGSSTISMEYPRAETMSFSSVPHHHHFSGPSGTPRASARTSSFAGTAGGQEQSMFIGASPVSTAGHHASAVTLGAGVFGKMNDGYGNTSEFDPERSLGRLVGELGRVMGSDKLPSRPTSPFSPPRSPSPLPSMHNQPANLSFTLNRNDPLLSPPSSGGEQTITQKQIQHQPTTKSNSNSRFSSLARELGDEIKQARTQQQPQQPRRALSDSTSHNIQNQPLPRPRGKGTNNNADRVKSLQGENRRSASAPSRTTRDNSLDVTGYTNLMATPAKGGEYGTLGKNGEVGGETGANIAGTLATLNARLRALETENSVSRRRVRELEDELEKARAEVEMAKQDGGKRLRDVIGEKSALEDLVKSLRSHLARLTVEVESNKALIAELRTTSSSPPRKNTTVAPGSPSVKSELASLRREIERLTQEVARLGGIVEEGLETRKKARGERTIRMEREEMERLVRQVMDEEHEAQQKAGKEKDIVEPSKLRQGLHTAASTSPTLAPPTVQPVRIAKSTHVPHHLTPPPSDDEVLSPTPVSRSNSRQGSSLGNPQPDTRKSESRRLKSKSSSRVSRDNTAFSAGAGGPSLPFPSIIDDEQEAEFFSPSRKTQSQARTTTRGMDGEELPPQTVLARVVRELEDDFEHYKMIYSELADQYKLLDPASISSKRHVLAEHLREVIDTLEQKADQIGDLYELLSFADKPLSGDGDAQGKEGKWVGKSVGDVLRMVKSSMGEEVWGRLESDLGLGRRKKGGKEV